MFAGDFPEDQSDPLHQPCPCQCSSLCVNRRPAEGTGGNTSFPKLGSFFFQFLCYHNPILFFLFIYLSVDVTSVAELHSSLFFIPLSLSVTQYQYLELLSNGVWNERIQAPCMEQMWPHQQKYRRPYHHKNFSEILKLSKHENPLNNGDNMLKYIPEGFYIWV